MKFLNNTNSDSPLENKQTKYPQFYFSLIKQEMTPKICINVSCAKSSSSLEPVHVTASHKPHHKQEFTCAMPDHCFSGENMYMYVKGWEWGSSANIKYFPFPSLNCCPHTEALSSAHSACFTELAALQQPCSHTLHTWGKWLIAPPGTPWKKAMEFLLFENDICMYSNS